MSMKTHTCTNNMQRREEKRREEMFVGSSECQLVDGDEEEEVEGGATNLHVQKGKMQR